MCETAQAQESLGGSTARESADWDGPHQVGGPDGGMCQTRRTPKSLSNVQSGDVLVSHSTPVREHEISIVPGAPHASSSTHHAAVSDGRSEAHAIGLDALLTEDQTHVVKIASNRTPDDE